MEHHTTERYERNQRLITYVLVLFVALAFILGHYGPAQPAPPQYYWPDPTPIIVETQHTEIFSNNRVCIGSFEHC